MSSVQRSISFTFKTRSYQGVWRTFTFEQAGEQVSDRVLVVWSAGKARLDQEKGKTYLKRLLNGLAAVQKKLNTRRYKQRAHVEQRIATLQRGNPMHRLVDVALGGEDETLSLYFALNREQLAEAQALDGRYALATNGEHLSAEQTLPLFNGQDGVEKRFPTVKGPLVVHPLFVRTDHRIEGLVFITLLALLASDLGASLPPARPGADGRSVVSALCQLACGGRDLGRW